MQSVWFASKDNRTFAFFKNSFSKPFFYQTIPEFADKAFVVVIIKMRPKPVVNSFKIFQTPRTPKGIKLFYSVILDSFGTYRMGFPGYKLLVINQGLPTLSFYHMLLGGGVNKIINKLNILLN